MSTELQAERRQAHRLFDRRPEQIRRRSKVRRNGWGRRVLVLASCVVGVVEPALADISNVGLTRNNIYTQTGNGTAVAYQGSYLTAGLTSSQTSEFLVVYMTSPGAGMLTLPATDSTHYAAYSQTYLTQAAMDAAYPAGTYTFYGIHLLPPDLETSFTWSSNAYPSTTPYLTGTDYADLQGMNSAASFTFHLSPFTPDPSTLFPLVFLNIYGPSTSISIGQFLPPTTTSITMSANTLQPNTLYTYELIYSDRVRYPSPGATFEAEVGFDLRTSGTFQTAVPEPSTAVLLALAYPLIALRRGRKSRAVFF